MGAWAYCRTCDAALEKPTIKQLYDQEQRCVNGHFNDPTGDVAESLGELEERLNKLEADNKRLKRQMARVFGVLSIELQVRAINEVMK